MKKVKYSDIIDKSQESKKNKIINFLCVPDPSLFSQACDLFLDDDEAFDNLITAGRRIENKYYNTF